MNPSALTDDHVLTALSEDGPGETMAGLHHTLSGELYNRFNRDELHRAVERMVKAGRILQRTPDCGYPQLFWRVPGPTGQCAYTSAVLEQAWIDALQGGGMTALDWSRCV